MVLGLRAKILIPSATILAVTVTAVSIFAVHRVGLILERKDLEFFASRADHLAEACVTAAETGEPSQLPDLIHLLTREVGTAWLGIYGQKGELLHSWKRSDMQPDPPLEQPISPTATTEREMLDAGQLHSGDGIYELRVPIRRSHPDLPGVEFLGCVRLGVSTAPAKGEAQATSMDLLIASALVAGLGIIMTFLFSRRITEPVWELVERTAEFSDGRFGRIAPIPRTREFAILARAFNVMAGRLAHFHREIRRQNQNLERAVRKRTADLQQALEDLKRLDQLKDEFLSNVSHELRTPMTSIRSFAEILRDYADDDPKMRTEFLGIIVSESERLSRLVEDFLDLAKIESGQMTWNFRAHSLEESIREVVQSLQTTAQIGKVKLSMELDGPCPELVGDVDRLKQVWTNLISNALKFTPAGKSVQVVVLSQGAEAHVEVRDEGPGIPAEFCEAVFERFRQVGGDLTTNKPKGTGLGLAISQDIVRRHHGRIELDSKVGVGSTFRVVLPRLAAAELEVEAAAEADLVSAS